MSLDISKLAPDAEGYLCLPDTGGRVVFHVCDPAKNFLCGKEMCRGAGGGEDEGEIGFCSCTMEAAFRKEGTRLFHKRLNDEGYYGREYIEEVGGDA